MSEHGPLLWRTAAVDAAAAARLAERLRVPPRVARWLCARTSDETEAAAWIDPFSQEVLPWSLFHGMEATAKRIFAAVQRGERICVIGDYDVDGVTASAIVSSCLEVLRADWLCIIPHRVEDGHGLSVPLVERAARAGTRLVVTVDNGVQCTDAISHATKLGVEVIVTDHHEPGASLPQAQAVVHWADSDRSSETKLLSGAGVARKLADALAAEAGLAGANDAAEGLRQLAEWHDGLATLGTLADIMPLRAENRRLVLAGLHSLRECTHPGWLALCNEAGVEAKSVSETSILWKITPRLNAAGRMSSAEVAFQLLMARNPADAAQLAAEVEEANRLRRDAVMRAAAEAKAMCQNKFADALPAGIAVAGAWPLGVVGIVAARLCDLYSRPVLVFADDGSGFLRGSGRAPSGFPLYEAVSRCARHLDHFGGHAAAVGCGLQAERLDTFAAAFAEAAEQWRMQEAKASCGADEEREPVADDYLPLADATLDTLEWVERLGPFGPGNPPLTFYLGPLEVVRTRVVGQSGQHLRITVRESGREAELVWFSADPDARSWAPGSRMAALAQLQENTWQGVRRAQLQITAAMQLDDHVVGRDVFSQVYRLLAARRRVMAHDLTDRFQDDPGRLRLIFDTFVELGFARHEESAYHMVDGASPSDLRESRSYQQHLAQAWLNP